MCDLFIRRCYASSLAGVMAEFNAVRLVLLFRYRAVELSMRLCLLLVG